MLNLKKFADNDKNKVAMLLSADNDWDISFGADHKSIVCRRGKYSSNMFVIEYDKKINDYIFSGVKIPSTIIDGIIANLQETK